ncbi:phosphoadenosine phosphosulfate reductase family protein [Methanomethylovorans sp.]|uniref:phosphoadenosine phosphosulfate reductase domain-containing protein n=1 Tax=Methanomethylovorans sp. TaxID=2758717 RepID=UPI000B1AE5CE|nr:phosphoadenosine phosphosulfate reductase family protein [Methanomethylovorans sp.]
MRTANKYHTAKEQPSSGKRVSSRVRSKPARSWKQHGADLQHHIFWCYHCNVPLLRSTCDVCLAEGSRLDLFPPGDIRFCSPYEKELIHVLLLSAFGCDPIGSRIILLNKTTGDDRTDGIIVDGLHFGVLRFDMRSLSHVLDLSIEGAKVLAEKTTNRTVVLRKASSHLSGKKIKADQILNFTEDIKKGDTVLIRCGNLIGFGISLLDHGHFNSSQDAVLRVKKLDGRKVSLNPRISSMQDIIEANKGHMGKISMDAANVIKGVASRREYRDLPVHVSFSGGKDSLVVLDLTMNALKGRDIRAFFLNTGIEFPETVEFVRHFCSDKGIQLKESTAGDAFWENLERFGPPAKDMRWCCKVCKLAPANRLIDESSGEGQVCLTVDGKRRYESFSRASISASERNPFVPAQLNIFPIRDWRALEVWMYIYGKKLDYNPLYDLGFERVGCYLCPASLSAEHQIFSRLHPDLYARWNTYLMEWTSKKGLPGSFVEHGLWRWKEPPPKILKLAEEIGIKYDVPMVYESFSVESVSGVSPCTGGGFTVEDNIRGISLQDAADVLHIIGPIKTSKNIGMLLVSTDDATVKFFSSGNLLVTASDREKAAGTFRQVLLQLMRVCMCTRCGICQGICPTGAIEVDDMRGLHISDVCIRCGKCIGSCVVLKYTSRNLPMIDLGHL